MEHDQRPGDDVPQADHIRFLFDPHTTLAALAGQRRRFAGAVATLSVEELASPSRCSEWTVADVLRHLVWVDSTMRRLWSGGSPPAGFDPRTTPNESVRADRAVPDEEIRQRYLSSTDPMAVELESADDQRVGQPSLSPAGRVPWWMSAVHMGWDSTVHERDVLAPLGRPIEVVHAETVPSLAYSLVLASLFDRDDPFHVLMGPVRLSRDAGPVTGEEVARPDGGDGNSLSVDGNVTVLTGDPVATIDALCGRGSLSDTVSGDATVIDRLGGLARFFASSG
jgi:uncharacterized protein (TIGR03083 family)